MIKKQIKIIIKNMTFFKSSLLLTLSLTAGHSFGDIILSPYETVHLKSASMREQIQLTNEKVQNDSEISEDIKRLVHAYTETITKCFVDYRDISGNAVTHALIGVHAYHFAVNELPEEQLIFFDFMSDLEEELSENLDCSLGKRSLAKAHTQVHISSTVNFPIYSELSDGEFEVTGDLSIREDRLALIDKVRGMDVPEESVLHLISSRKLL